MNTADETRDNLEISSKEPNLSKMMAEIERAQPRMQNFLRRNQNAFNSWNSRWDGQTNDGRRHPLREGEDVFPFEGASDSRIRTVKQVIKDHVTIAKASFNGAKVQAQSVRPMKPGEGKRSTQAGWLLKWMLFTHMRAELQRELPIGYAWRFGYGACIRAIEWEQTRRLEYHDLTIPALADVLTQRDGLDQNQSGQLFFQLQAAFSDPSQQPALTELISGLVVDQKGEPVLTGSQVRKIVRDLSTVRTTKVPIPVVFTSKPKWTSLRIGIDIVFLDLTGDLQEEPWIARYERVSETTLRDRIETEDYDSAFVEAAIEKKGPRSEETWRYQASYERAFWGDGMPNWSGDLDDNGIDLIHFSYKTVCYGTPCIYRTIFCPALVQRGNRPGDKQLYAKHGDQPYSHGQYPYIPQRFEKDHRPITSSQGIAELAYTWEQEEKAQADGMADRTQLINRPPMIVPYSRVHSIKGQPMPGAVLGVTKPQEIQWQELPPNDGTPIEVMKMVAIRVQEFFGINGESVDPDKKLLRRQEIADDVLGEETLAIEQSFQLMQQYMTDDEVSAVVGQMDQPFAVAPQEIRDAHEISATFNAKLLDVAYATSLVDLYAKALPLSNGSANSAEIFRRIIETIDPDAADSVVENNQDATDRERREEKQACIEMLNGSEPDKPMFANNQLRIQVIEQFMQQPLVKQKLMQAPELLQLFRNRVTFFMNQMQQYQQNPGIGRALSTQTFDSKAAPQMQMAGVGGS